MNRRQRLGHQGEDLAADFLSAQGYVILKRRYRVAAGEIDIIARQGRTLVFIEVKTRTSTVFGWPAEAVTPNKQNKIRQVALHYLQHEGAGSPGYKDIRFDVVSVIMEKNGHYRLEHIESAF